jgi:hypothetical protein
VREQLREFLCRKGALPADRRKSDEAVVEQQMEDDDNILELILPESPLYR